MSFPNLPGVPPLKNSGLAAVTTLAAPGINLLLDQLKPKWLILKSDGTTVALSPDSFLGIEFKNESNVSNFPIEQGSLNTYNKVKTPFNAIIKVSKGSSITSVGTSSTSKSRSDFIQALEAMNDDLNTYIIKTPEKTYKDVNLMGHDYRRDADSGAGIIIVYLHFVQIMNAQILTKTPNDRAFSVEAATGFSPSSMQPATSNGQLSCQANQSLIPGVH